MTTDNEFRPWRSIERYQGIHVQIAEKLHGTSAQVHVQKQLDGTLKALAGKRTSYVGTTGHFGFGEFVANNGQALCDSLGEGRHYGEWVGPGVNGQYGLTEKVFVLFNHRYHLPKKLAGKLPNRVDVVPVLYDGPYTPTIIGETMDNLKASGSVFAPGFMKPEGVVLFFPQFNTMQKKVFKPEETGWDKSNKPPRDPNAPKVDFGLVAAPYLQSVRLEKVLLKEEAYMANFPKSLPDIVRAYLADLFVETVGLPEDTIRAIKKSSFPWAMELVPEMIGRLLVTA